MLTILIFTMGMLYLIFGPATRELGILLIGVLILGTLSCIHESKTFDVVTVLINWVIDLLIAFALGVGVVMLLIQSGYANLLK